MTRGCDAIHIGRPQPTPIPRGLLDELLVAFTAHLGQQGQIACACGWWVPVAELVLPCRTAFGARGTTPAPQLLVDHFSTHSLEDLEGLVWRGAAVSLQRRARREAA